MLIDILKCIVYIFAVYGVLVLILGISEAIRCRMTGQRPRVRTVIFVKDAQEQIEYIVRYAVKNEYAGKVLSDKKLVIVDMDSEDNTYELLEKLQNNFPSIQVLKKSEIISIINEFE